MEVCGHELFHELE